MRFDRGSSRVSTKGLGEYQLGVSRGSLGIVGWVEGSIGLRASLSVSKEGVRERRERRRTVVARKKVARTMAAEEGT